MALTLTLPHRGPIPVGYAAARPTSPIARPGPRARHESIACAAHLPRLLLVLVFLLVPVVVFVLVGRIADRRFVIVIVIVVVVAGAGGIRAAPAIGIQTMARPVHCGGIRSFCPG